MVKVSLTLTPEQAKVLFNCVDGASDAGACAGGNTPQEAEALVDIMHKLLRQKTKWIDIKLGGLNNDMFGSRSPHGLYRDIVHDAMEWATAEIQRLNAIYCERTDCLPRHPDYEAQRSAAVAEIERERKPFPPDLGAQGEPVARDDAQRRMAAQILTGIRGGNATGTTAEMLRALADSDEIAFPLAGGMERPHLRERAGYLEMADSTTCHLGEELEQTPAKPRTGPDYSLCNGDPEAAPAAPRTGSGVSVDEIEAASAAYYDGMIGSEEDSWPHHRGWAGKSETFKDKVRAHMARALKAALQAPRSGETEASR